MSSMECPNCKKSIHISAEFNGWIQIECWYCGEKIVLQGGHGNINIVRMNMMCAIGG